MCELVQINRGFWPDGLALLILSGRGPMSDVYELLAIWVPIKSAFRTITGFRRGVILGRINNKISVFARMLRILNSTVKRRRFMR